MRATIVGAGIGGLALAGLLRREGWQVTVRERATALPESGTTLGMWPEAMAVLDDLGVGDRVRDHGVHQRGGRILTAGGRQLAGIDTADGAWLINRPELVAALASVAGPVEFGAAVPDWQSAAGRTDLLVGADGVHSVVRATLGPAVPRRPGITIWRGRASVASTEAVETWAPGHLFGFTPRPTGDPERVDTNWFATMNRAPESAPRELPEVFADWHPQVRQVVEAIDPEFTLRHEALLAPPLRRFVRTDPDATVALIGDAAHAMAPNLGRGACETLLDAAELAGQLRAHPLSRALPAYQRRRRTRALALARASRLLGRLATAGRGLALRDLAVSTLSRWA